MATPPPRRAPPLRNLFSHATPPATPLTTSSGPSCFDRRLRLTRGGESVPELATRAWRQPAPGPPSPAIRSPAEAPQPDPPPASPRSPAADLNRPNCARKAGAAFLLARRRVSRRAAQPMGSRPASRGAVLPARAAGPMTPPPPAILRVRIRW